MRFVHTLEKNLLARLVSFLAFLITFGSFFNELTNATPVPEHSELRSDNHNFKRGACSAKPKLNSDPATILSAKGLYVEDPSVDDIKADLTSMGIIHGKTSLYYTNLGDMAGELKARLWACAYLAGEYVDFQQLLPDYFQEARLQNILIGNRLRMELFAVRLSWAYSELSEGDVYLIIPAGTEPKPHSIWAKYEEPALQRNPKVLRIIRVDPDRNFQSTLWTKGDPINTLPPGPEERSGPPNRWQSGR